MPSYAARAYCVRSHRSNATQVACRVFFSTLTPVRSILALPRVPVAEEHNLREEPPKSIQTRCAEARPFSQCARIISAVIPGAAQADGPRRRAKPLYIRRRGPPTIHVMCALCSSATLVPRAHTGPCSLCRASTLPLPQICRGPASAGATSSACGVPRCAAPVRHPPHHATRPRHFPQAPRTPRHLCRDASWLAGAWLFNCSRA